LRHFSQTFVGNDNFSLTKAKISKFERKSFTCNRDYFELFY